MRMLKVFTSYISPSPNLYVDLAIFNFWPQCCNYKAILLKQTYIGQPKIPVLVKHPPVGEVWLGASFYKSDYMLISSAAQTFLWLQQ